MRQEALYTLRMIRPSLDVSPARHTNHKRYLPFPIRAIMKGRNFIKELVDPRPKIVGKLYLSHGPVKPISRNAHSNPYNGSFRQRRIEATHRPKSLGKTARYSKNPALSTRHILTKNHDMRIKLHLFTYAMINCIHHNDLLS